MGCITCRGLKAPGGGARSAGLRPMAPRVAACISTSPLGTPGTRWFSHAILLLLLLGPDPHALMPSALCQGRRWPVESNTVPSDASSSNSVSADDGLMPVLPRHQAAPDHLLGVDPVVVST